VLPKKSAISKKNKFIISLVPMLCVGMQFVTLCVTERRAFPYEFPRRPWELGKRAINKKAKLHKTTWPYYFVSINPV